MPELSAVLSTFDESATSITEGSISSAVEKIRSEADTSTPPMEWLAEVMAFQFAENYTNKETGWGTYFGPMWVVPNGNGMVSESPSIKRITPEILTYWEGRGRVARNPVLRARYADLVWDFSKHVTGKGAHIDNARIAIDSLVAIAAKNAHKHEIEVIRKLGRALSLAISISDSGRIRSVKEAIIQYEDRIAQDDKPALWGFSYDLLVGNKKVELSHPELDKIISDLEQRLERISSKPQSSSVDPWAVEAVVLRLSSYYRTSNRPDDMRRVLLLHGKAFEKASKSASASVVSSWLQRVHGVYLEYGLKDKAEEIAVKLREIGPKSNEDMKSISHTMEIPKDEMIKYLDALTDGDLQTVLKRLSVHFIPQKSKVEAQIYDLSKTAPLTFLIPKQIQDSKGRPVATIGSLEEDLDGNIVHQMSQHMGLSVMFLNEVLKTVIVKFQLSPDILLDYLYASPVFGEEKKPIIRNGLSAYFASDHLFAAHLLIPQIEDAIRNLVEMTGGSVLKPSRGGGFQLKTLDDLLRDERIDKLFGENATFYFRVLLTDQRGWNLRNDICHGILPAESFNPPISDRIVHALLCLALVKKTEDKQ